MTRKGSFMQNHSSILILVRRLLLAIEEHDEWLSELNAMITAYTKRSLGLDNMEEEPHNVETLDNKKKAKQIILDHENQKELEMKEPTPNNKKKTRSKPLKASNETEDESDFILEEESPLPSTGKKRGRPPNPKPDGEEESNSVERPITRSTRRKSLPIKPETLQRNACQPSPNNKNREKDTVTPKKPKIPAREANSLKFSADWTFFPPAKEAPEPPPEPPPQVPPESLLKLRTPSPVPSPNTMVTRRSSREQIEKCNLQAPVLTLRDIVNRPDPVPPPHTPSRTRAGTDFLLPIVVPLPSNNGTPRKSSRLNQRNPNVSS